MHTRTWCRPSSRTTCRCAAAAPDRHAAAQWTADARAGSPHAHVALVALVTFTPFVPPSLHPDQEASAAQSTNTSHALIPSLPSASHALALSMQPSLHRRRLSGSHCVWTACDCGAARATPPIASGPAAPSRLRAPPTVGRWPHGATHRRPDDIAAGRRSPTAQRKPRAARGSKHVWGGAAAAPRPSLTAGQRCRRRCVRKTPQSAA